MSTNAVILYMVYIDDGTFAKKLNIKHLQLIRIM